MKIKLKTDTYYIISVICILFVMNRFKYTIAEQEFQTWIVLFVGIICTIFALIMTFRKDNK